MDLDNALEVGEVKLFPNPSDGFFRVQFDVASAATWRWTYTTHRRAHLPRDHHRLQGRYELPLDLERPRRRHLLPVVVRRERPRCGQEARQANKGPSPGRGRSPRAPLAATYSPRRTSSSGSSSPARGAHHGPVNAGVSAHQATWGTTNGLIAPCSWPRSSGC